MSFVAESVASLINRAAGLHCGCSRHPGPAKSQYRRTWVSMYIWAWHHLHIKTLIVSIVSADYIAVAVWFAGIYIHSTFSASIRYPLHQLIDIISPSNKRKMTPRTSNREVWPPPFDSSIYFSVVPQAKNP
ncbi:hypothetical protein IQ07DRAFT_105682 [Pyrenochaeta sp. DS3sAY3a]|nr:hypothetical protein IQ07DRAFT_105682 [Pyrenochaeta sp. DS3sAY3a]